MKGRRDERTLTMMENYMPLFESGMAPKEIAMEFGLSGSTVYRCVGAVADKAGVSRESLLKQPHASPTNWDYVPEPIPDVSIASFREHLEEALKNVDSMIADMKAQIDLQQEQIELEEEEQ